MTNEESRRKPCRYKRVWAKKERLSKLWMGRAQPTNPPRRVTLGDPYLITRWVHKRMDSHIILYLQQNVVVSRLEPVQLFKSTISWISRKTMGISHVRLPNSDIEPKWWFLVEDAGENSCKRPVT